MNQAFYEDWRAEVKVLASAYEVSEDTVIDAVRLLLTRRGDLDVRDLVSWHGAYEYMEYAIQERKRKESK